MLEFTETLPGESWTQRFLVEEVLFRRRTEHQDLVVFRNPDFGRVLALDGVVQTAEADEFIYHEMLAHVPILAHGRARRVLIIGGGDGGILREVLRHPGVEQAVMVEIDAEVVEICRTHLPRHAGGAFEDARTRLIIADGARWVQETGERFDVVISDSTDPIGPGEALYTREFYAGCRRCLREGGVLVTQNGNSFSQLGEIATTARRLAPLFEDFGLYGAAVPTYIGGAMTFAWASDDAALREVPLQRLHERLARSGIAPRYYTPEVHRAAFALPRYVLDALDAPR